MTVSAFLDNALKLLNPRQLDIVTGRFGIGKHGKVQTLAALGARYGITRERVRQIETAALTNLRQNLATSKECKAFVEKAKKLLKDAGGVATSQALVADLRATYADLSEHHLRLVVEATRAFGYEQADDEWHSFFYLDAAARDAALEFVTSWISTLSTEKQGVLAGRYKQLLAAATKSAKLTPKVANHYLATSKLIHANAYGDTGLVNWSEIKPTTVRDQIYLVLKKHSKPLHFEDIAKVINDAKIAARPALAATVHNELIKDGRFVLVGRGIYALAEQGYVAGTAKEVIHRILSDRGPLKPKDIVLAVQKQRFFKENTILVNLQNKAHFERRADGSYHVREA